MTSLSEQVREPGREARNQSIASADALEAKVRPKPEADVSVDVAQRDDVDDEAPDVCQPRLPKRYSMMWFDNMRQTRPTVDLGSIAHHFDDLERCGSVFGVCDAGRKSLLVTRNGRSTLGPLAEVGCEEDDDGEPSDITL